MHKDLEPSGLVVFGPATFKTWRHGVTPNSDEEFGVQLQVDKDLKPLPHLPYSIEIIPATPIPDEKLRSSFAAAMTTLEAMFQAAMQQERQSGLGLHSVEVHLEISAEGKLGFMGSGVKATGSTSFKLTFQRKP